MNREPYGRALRTGYIAVLRSPDTDLDEALATGADRAMEFFSDMIAGLREGHLQELRALGFFRAVREQIGVDVDAGSWEAVGPAHLHALARIIDAIVPHATEGVGHLLEDLRQMARQASERGCSIAFLLAE